jgi:hypothetical protein
VSNGQTKRCTKERVISCSLCQDGNMKIPWLRYYRRFLRQRSKMYRNNIYKLLLGISFMPSVSIRSVAKCGM